MRSVPPSGIALTSILLYNCVTAIFAYLSHIMHVSMYQLIALQTFPILLVFCTYIVASGTPHGILGPPGTRLELWVMAVFAVAATLPILFTLNALTLSEHVTVMCTLPFVTAFMSWVWLGEKFTRTQAICCVICIAGVMIVTDPFRIREPATSHGRKDGIPDTLSGKLIGMGLTFLGVCLRAPQFVMVRKIGDRATTAQILTITYIALAIAAPILMLITRNPVAIPSNPLGWGLLVALVLVGMSADTCITYAGQRTSPTTITICPYAGVIFSNCIQWLLYGNYPSPVAFSGMGIVLVAGLYGVIYGPAEAPKEDEEVEADLESSRPLLSGNDGAADYGGAVETGR